MPNSHDSKKRHNSTTDGLCNMGFAGVIVSVPVAAMTFVVALLVGYSLIQTVLITWAVQILVIGAIVIMGLLRRNHPAPTGKNTAEISPETADIW